ncbi:MAG: crossover junction endodeoxyribonuclease RuvC [Bacteroidota bacterium]
MATPTDTERIILGIDPGTNITGYGVIRCVGNRMAIINYGIIDMRKVKDNDHSLKLKRIFERTLGLIEEYLPDEMAIEAPFYGKNVQSMLKLGRAQGVAMAAALYREVPIREYAPKKVKMAITGSGNAGKSQVMAMLEKLLHFKFAEATALDASDGLAVAVCHFLQRDLPQHSPSKKKGNRKSAWGNFIANNPDRLK